MSPWWLLDSIACGNFFFPPPPSMNILLGKEPVDFELNKMNKVLILFIIVIRIHRSQMCSLVAVSYGDDGYEQLLTLYKLFKMWLIINDIVWLTEVYWFSSESFVENVNRWVIWWDVMLLFLFLIESNLWEIYNNVVIGREKKIGILLRTSLLLTRSQGKKIYLS